MELETGDISKNISGHICEGIFPSVDARGELGVNKVTRQSSLDGLLHFIQLDHLTEYKYIFFLIQT